ncbi:Kinesin-like protein [Trichinella pseudospiralis]
MLVKLMKQKKVKARMTPSKSWTTLRRKRDQKRYEQRRREKAKTRTAQSRSQTHETDRGRHEAVQRKTRGICGAPWVPILLDRIVRWSFAFVGQIMVSIDTLEKTRFAEVERKGFFITKTQ